MRRTINIVRSNGTILRFVPLENGDIERVIINPLAKLPKK